MSSVANQDLGHSQRMAFQAPGAFPITQGYNGYPHPHPALQQIYLQPAASAKHHQFGIVQKYGQASHPPNIGSAPVVRVVATGQRQALPSGPAAATPAATAAAACPPQPPQQMVLTAGQGSISSPQATTTAVVAGSKTLPCTPTISKVVGPAITAGTKASGPPHPVPAAHPIPTFATPASSAAAAPTATTNSLAGLSNPAQSSCSSSAIIAVPDPNGGPTRWVGPAAPPIRRTYLNSKALNMKYKFDGDFKIAGKPILLEIDPPESERAHRATGLRVWDGGIVLARYMEQYAKAKSASKLKALELGCGTGIAGFGLAYLGHDVVLSDLGELQQQSTEANIQRNASQVASGGGQICYRTLDWNKLPERSSFGAFDVVFAGDVIWHETLVEPFLNALTWVCSGAGTKDIVLSHKIRDQESVAVFEEMAAKRGLSIAQKVVSDQLLGEEEGHPEVTIYHLSQSAC